jgi:hypothetical protein
MSSPPSTSQVPSSVHPSDSNAQFTTAEAARLSPPSVAIPRRPGPADNNPSLALAHSTSAAERLARLYPAPTPPLPETPHPHRTLLSPNGAGAFSPSAPLDPPDEPAVALQPFPKAASPMTIDTAAPRAPAAPRIPWRRKLVLVLVGLPARGKSYIAYKLMGYLRWRGLNANLFNVGKVSVLCAQQASSIVVICSSLLFCIVTFPAPTSSRRSGACTSVR